MVRFRSQGFSHSEDSGPRKSFLEVIVKGVRTGQIGDGKIFILDLAECIRVRTGETGHE